MEPDEPPSSSSSFPISSPTFWTEAAREVTPLVEIGSKRDAGDLGHSGDQEVEPGAVPKRARFADRPRSRSRSPTTNLSYLPNRLGPFNQDDPHSYLANPEYAPNAFGDIGDYMRKKEIKVQTQNRDIALASAAEGTPQIFAGLSFYINGNTHPPMEELRKMILQRGGEVRPVLRNKGMVKFIIAPMLTQMKFKQFQNYRVVKEAWITESCKEGKLLDWSRWKLQAQGGWEESSRKGLEGFLGASQAAKLEPAEGTSAINTTEVDAVGVQAEQEDEAGPIPGVAPISLGTATQKSLLRPIRATPIPISPGAVKKETPEKEKVPAKVHKPEGAWEHYYTKDSNVDAARLLKDQEWRLKNTAERGNEGGFIDGYYQNSRLHHLSTWKAELKVLVAAAQKQSEEQSLDKPSAASLSPYTLSTSILPKAAQSTSAPGEKVIFHVDFDCFFVSCGVASRPHLKGKPVVVCHSQAGRGASSTSEIASASYEARAKGVRNGMSLGRARALAGSELQTIPYEFDTYKKFSLSFYTVLMGYADELQAVSVDEALIDVTSAVAAKSMAPEEATEDDGVDPAAKHRDPAVEIAEKIRDEVRKLTDGCEVSIGISHNVLLAKLATRRAKPAGIFHLVPADVPAFLAPLDVEDFPSVGYSIRRRIEDKFGTSQVEPLLERSLGAFKALLGQKTGDMVYGYLRGVDKKTLEPHKERKSISAEMNYGIRFQNQDQAEICVKDLAAEVSKRMKQVNARGRLITLKLLSRHPDAPIEPPKFLGHGWCETINKSSPIGNKGGSATDDAEILGVEAVKLLRAIGPDPVELRGVGIQITKLDSEKPAEREAGQGTLSFGAKTRSMSLAQTGSTKTLKEGSPISETADGLTIETVKEDANGQPPPHLSPPSDGVQTDRLSPNDAGTGPENPTIVATTGTRRSPPLTRKRSAILESHQSEAGPSRIVSSSDGIDPEFLAALPADLRQEVKRDFGRSRRSASTSTTNTEPPLGAQQKVEKPPKGKHAAAHITKQLRPKTKTQLKASAIADLPLYGAWAKASHANHDEDAASEVISIIDDDGVDEESIGPYRIAELRELGVDPDVFQELPENMRKEIVTEERQRLKQRKSLRRSADTSRFRSRERETSLRTASLSPSKTSRAGSIPPPATPLASVTMPPKPALLKATALPEVLETVTRWIESREGAPPAPRDASKVRAYLLKCMDAKTGGSGGIEAAVEVLKWMKLLLEEHWKYASPEAAVDHEVGKRRNSLQGGGENDAGVQWWKTWREFKGEVDRVALQRLGAPLVI